MGNLVTCVNRVIWLYFGEYYVLEVIDEIF